MGDAHVFVIVVLDLVNRLTRRRRLASLQLVASSVCQCNLPEMSEAQIMESFFTFAGHIQKITPSDAQFSEILQSLLKCQQCSQA